MHDHLMSCRGLHIIIVFHLFMGLNYCLAEVQTIGVQTIAFPRNEMRSQPHIVVGLLSAPMFYCH